MECPFQLINLSKLRLNMRSRYNKKCDTKKGRVGDTDEDAIIAAPDSTIKVNESLFFKKRQTMRHSMRLVPAEKKLLHENL